MNGAGQPGPLEAVPKRWLHVGIALVLGVAGAGYVSGLRVGTGVRAEAGPPEPRVESAERAPSYAEAREVRQGANARMYDGALEVLADKVAPPPAQGEQMPADRQRVLASRRERRAYDGAPPTIPHEIDQTGAPDCAGCHGRGLHLGEKSAPKLSHERYQSCTQCHVMGTAPKPLPKAHGLPANTFVGHTGEGGGQRAWTGAPPTIPHPTMMRSECNSCHGPGGKFGLKTPHPDRQSCTQCHAPSADLDQRPRGGGAPVAGGTGP